MDVSSYILLSHEQALRRRLDIAANNLANMSTVGFKREQPVFREYVEQLDNAVKPAEPTSFVLDFGAIHDTSAGAFQPTGNPLDVMVDGPGYLAVQTPDGGTAYTRAGFMTVLQDGTLATSSGAPILGEGGRTINIPADQVGQLTVLGDGTINGRDGPLGRIAVTVFDSEASVSPRGDGLMDAANGRELTAAQTKLKSGGVEASNVNPISETTDMVEILRAYQMSQRIGDAMSDLRKRAIDRLGRPGN